MLSLYACERPHPFDHRAIVTSRFLHIDAIEMMIIHECAFFRVTFTLREVFKLLMKKWNTAGSLCCGTKFHIILCFSLSVHSKQGVSSL